MLAWHARHRFCANCGAPTDMSQAGWKRECPACKVEHFPRTDPVVIMLAVDGDRCLLGRAGRFVANMWSCLAGFIEPGESIEDAVRRETLEEAGIDCGRVKYFASQPWPFPMSLMIGCHAAGDHRRDHGRPRGTGGRALVHPRRGRADVHAASTRKGSASRRRSRSRITSSAPGSKRATVSSAERASTCCAPASRCRTSCSASSVSAPGGEDAGERIPHHQRRQRGERRGRDRAARRTRELRGPARRAGRHRSVGDTMLALVGAREHRLLACPRVAGAPRRCRRSGSTGAASARS